VISDLRRPIEGAVVEAQLSWTGGQRSWRWGGDVPADACARVGSLVADVPEAPGPLTVELTCRHGDEVAHNRYDALIREVSSGT
jgi:hypothetical protein